MGITLCQHHFKPSWKKINIKQHKNRHPRVRPHTMKHITLLSPSRQPQHNSVLHCRDGDQRRITEKSEKLAKSLRGPLVKLSHYSRETTKGRARFFIQGSSCLEQLHNRMSLYCHKKTKLSFHCLNDLCNTPDSVNKVRRSCCCNTSEKLQPPPRRCKKVGAHQSSARRTSGIQRHCNSRRQGTKCVWTKHNREDHIPRTKWHDNASLPSLKLWPDLVPNVSDESSPSVKSCMMKQERSCSEPEASVDVGTAQE